MGYDDGIKDSSKYNIWMDPPYIKYKLDYNKITCIYDTQ